MEQVRCNYPQYCGREWCDCEPRWEEVMPQYKTVGGYPNTDPHYVSPQEEAELFDQIQEEAQMTEARITVWYVGRPVTGEWREATYIVWAQQLFEYVAGIPATVEYR
jgi:hypothetical protein